MRRGISGGQKKRLTTGSFHARVIKPLAEYIIFSVDVNEY